MKAYWIAAGASGTTVELRETATPGPKAGEIVVRVRATSLNRGELLGGKAGARPSRAAASARARSSAWAMASRVCRPATA